MAPSPALRPSLLPVWPPPDTHPFPSVTLEVCIIDLTRPYFDETNSKTNMNHYRSMKASSSRISNKKMCSMFWHSEWKANQPWLKMRSDNWEFGCIIFLRCKMRSIELVTRKFGRRSRVRSPWQSMDSKPKKRVNQMYTSIREAFFYRPRNHVGLF